VGHIGKIQTRPDMIHNLTSPRNKSSPSQSPPPSGLPPSSSPSHPDPSRRVQWSPRSSSPPRAPSSPSTRSASPPLVVATRRSAGSLRRRRPCHRSHTGAAGWAWRRLAPRACRSVTASAARTGLPGPATGVLAGGPTTRRRARRPCHPWRRLREQSRPTSRRSGQYSC